MSTWAPRTGRGRRLAHAIETASSDKRQHARTPDAIFRLIASAMFARTGERFTVDAAANRRNAKLPRFFGPGGAHRCFLSAPWHGEVVFLNPPFVLAGVALDRASWEARNHGVRSAVLCYAKTAGADVAAAIAAGASVGVFPARVEYEPGPGIEFSRATRDSMLYLFDGRGEVFVVG